MQLLKNTTYIISLWCEYFDNILVHNFKQLITSLYLNQANIYIKGSEGFCSIASDGQLVKIGEVDIPRNDARSVAVPIVPKRTGEVDVEVVSVFQHHTADSVVRKLFVVVSMETLNRICLPHSFAYSLD